MKRLTIHRARTQLPSVIARLRPGETVLIYRGSKPIAELRALPVRRRRPRPFGLYAGKFTVPPSFFDPLPDDLLDAFEGKAP